MTRCVARDGLLHHYFNKFDPVVSRGESEVEEFFSVAIILAAGSEV
jgi:hypothetical protein